MDGSIDVKSGDTSESPSQSMKPDVLMDGSIDVKSGETPVSASQSMKPEVPDVKPGETPESASQSMKPEVLDGSNGNIHVKSGMFKLSFWPVKRSEPDFQREFESRRADPTDHSARLRIAKEMRVDWQAILRQQIEDVKLKHLGPLKEMYQKLLRKINSPSNLKSEQLDKLKVCKSMLDRLIEFFGNSKDDLSYGDAYTFARYTAGIDAFVRSGAHLEPLSWRLMPNWLEPGEHHVHQKPNPWQNITAPKQPNFSPLQLKQKDAAVKKNSEIEVMAQDLRRLASKVDKIESLVKNLGEKNSLLEERVQSLEVNTKKFSGMEVMTQDFEKQTTKVDEIEALVENLGEKNGLLEERVKTLEENVPRRSKRQKVA